MSKEPGCDSQETAEFLRALAHPSRLQILCRLLEGEAAVSAFEAELGLKQPNLSQQLGLLREAKLVATRREAKSVFYSLADERVRVVIGALQSVFAKAPKRARPRPKAGQRPAVIASARAMRPPSAPTKPASECGVFAVAGWNTSPSTRRG